MTTDAALFDTFYGRDPLAGEVARVELIRRHGADAIRVLLPRDSEHTAGSIQIDARLRATGRELGAGIAPYLTDVIRRGEWFAKTAAAKCFGGLHPTDAVVDPLVAILEEGGDFDAERPAVESLGFLGAVRQASALVGYSRTGSWRNRFDDFDEDSGESPYEFAKLASYVLEALTRFLANAESADDSKNLVEMITAYVARFDVVRANRSPSAVDLIERHVHEFTGWSIDPVIAHWGQSENRELQLLCMRILGAVAPVRAARFLLKTAVSPSTEPRVRAEAAIALGEIRHQKAAELLAEALRDSSIDRTHLEWPLSTLYAVPIDWHGTESFVEEVLAGDGEPARQLRYSLALRGDRRVAAKLESLLDSEESHERWTAALALARLFGADALPLLEQRAEDAGEATERCGQFAALVRAGDGAGAAALHGALMVPPFLPHLRTVWKAEIIGAFRAAPDFDPRAFGLWRTTAWLGARQVQYLDAIDGQHASAIDGKPSSTGAMPASSPSMSTSTPRVKAEASKAAVEAPSPTIPSEPRMKLFVSYSHKDRAWLERFQIALNPLIRNARLELWDDMRITPGKWRPQIKSALADANVALFLVSQPFLASDFIMQQELPDLLAMANDNRATILWVLLEECLWEETPLTEYQGENGAQALMMMSAGEQSAAVVKTCRKIRDLLRVARPTS